MSDDERSAILGSGPEETLRHAIGRAEGFSRASDILKEESAAVLELAARARDVRTLAEALTVAKDLAEGAVLAFASAASKIELEIEKDRIKIDAARGRGPSQVRH